jgi:hypothetical protein
MVVITLRVMIRHAERDGYYQTSFAERKPTMVVITLRVMIRHAERDGCYQTSFAERKPTLEPGRLLGTFCRPT